MDIADLFTFFVTPSLLGIVAMWATLRGTT